MKLDLACGGVKKEGFVGVDRVSLPGVDVVCDLEKFPWEPFADNSVDEIYCSHYIEHTPNLVAFMNEVCRICKPGAPVKFIAPYYTSIGAWRDPTHRRAISEETFFYFNRAWREKSGVAHYDIVADFALEKLFFNFESPWDKSTTEEQQYASRHYWNAVSQITVEMRVRKT